VSVSVGSFCLVLHGHLPWVLHHGRWPHGEDWLYEAAAETWMPLIDVLDRASSESIRVAWTVGVTPILLEQLRSETFRDGFRRYLAHHVDRAREDERDFERRGDRTLAGLAAHERVRHEQMADRFAGLGGDVVGALARHARAGQIEMLSSNATHAFHPLVLHDATARAQVRAGLSTSTRHLGFRPNGVWLPECAYRPPGSWMPPVVHGDRRNRAGVARLFADEGVRYFFVEHHLVTTATPEAALDGDRVVDASPRKDDGRAWCTWLEPHRVVEGGVLTDLTVYGRAMDVAEQVWSADVGYPGDGRYREFHKRHGWRGLRYWRVTGRGVDLGDKGPYDPAAAHDAVYTHADHFVDGLRRRLHAHRQGSGRHGTVCAPFDAELFGHWWAEGPDFLLEVARRLAHDDTVAARTIGEDLEKSPPDKAASLPEGTWGDGGDHRVWLRAETRAYWEAEYRAEDRFLDLWHRAPWRTNERIRTLLTEAGRQLLLLMASDWPFVISTAGAVDYGWRRIREHAARFDDLCAGVEDLVAGDPEPVQATASYEFCRKVDPVFPDLDLSWWADS
jgi:1,4-alpha-glucan branching enzyme